MRVRNEARCQCGVIRHKTCKGCGQTNLIWTGSPGHFRLADHITRELHTCAAFRHVNPDAAPATHPDFTVTPAGGTYGEGHTHEHDHDHDENEWMTIRDAVLSTIRPEIERIASQAQRPEIHIHPLNAPEIVLNGHTHPNMRLLLTLASARKNVFLIGPAGSGKTTGGEKVAEALGLAFYPFSVGPATVEHALFGYMNAAGTYVPGHLFKPFTEGGLFLLDEFDSAHAGAVTAINAALANGYASFPHGVFAKHPDFVCLAAGNTYGNGADRIYVGRAQLDGATLDRFNFVRWDYDRELESALLSARVDAAPNADVAAEIGRWGRFVWSVRDAVDATGVRMPVSTRSIIDGADGILAGLSFDDVARMRFWERMSADDAAKIQARI